jgi:predicted transcriptional regulator
MMSYLPTFEEIKEFRIKLGISRKELAKVIDVSPNMIIQIETDRAKPGVDNFRKIFEYFYQKSDETETKLEEIMATPIKFLTPNRTLQNAKELFETIEDMDIIPILNNDKDKLLIGKISKKGLEEYLENNPNKISTTIVGNILEESPATFPHDTQKTWIRPFIQKRNSCVLVTKLGKIVGIVNYWDYLSKI